MLRKYIAGALILAVGVVNASLVSSAMAFQRSSSSNIVVSQQDGSQLNTAKGSWSRGGVPNAGTNNRKVDTLTTKKGMWFRGGVRQNSSTENAVVFNK